MADDAHDEGVRQEHAAEQAREAAEERALNDVLERFQVAAREIVDIHDATDPDDLWFDTRSCNVLLLLTHAIQGVVFTRTGDEETDDRRATDEAPAEGSSEPGGVR